MGHPLRHQEAGAVYELTNGSLHQIFVLKPDEEVNKIILGLLAKMAWRYRVEIFAFCFMSNHFHILARSRTLQLHLFMRDFQSALAVKLNQHWGRTGTFWARRYTAIKVLDDETMVDRLRYTVCNPSESNLVRHPNEWPGLCSWDIHKAGEPMWGEVVNRKLYWKLKRRKENKYKPDWKIVEMATERFPLEMAKLSPWENLDDEAYHEKIVEVCHNHAGDLAKARRKPCLGAQKVLAQHWSDQPKKTRKRNSPRPLCHGGSPDERKKYRKTRRDTTGAYRTAVKWLRKGRTGVTFPDGTIPPGWQFCEGGSTKIRTEAPAKGK